jgi:hypothetical protein
VQTPDEGASTGPATVRLSNRVARLVRTAREAWRVRAFRARIAKRPDDHHLMATFGAYLEAAGRYAEAVDCYTRLAHLYRRRRDADELHFCLRKLERYGAEDTTRILRDLATLYAELKRFDEAARACRGVVASYVAGGHVSAATGFVRQLPPLGSLDRETREALEVEIAARRVTRATAPLPMPRETAPQESFLNGVLGRITPYDVVQIVETNRVTGRCDIEVADGPAVLHFDGGRIVAARYGTSTGRDAAQRIFGVTSAPFRVVITDVTPEDEFLVDSNTGLLLDVLRVMDEEQHGL